MTTEDLGDLIGRVSLGDRNAFRRLYDLTSPKLFAVCLRILKQKDEAEDALQDVYLKIWHNAGKFEVSDYSPVTWLAAVARNLAIDRVRSRKPETVEIGEVPDIPDDRPNPERRAVASADGARIDRCLDELNADRANAVREAYIEGYSYQELADRYRLPVNTVRTWLRRSLIRLRECLQR